MGYSFIGPGETALRCVPIMEYYIRELAQKPREPHALFGHCAKLPGFYWVRWMILRVHCSLGSL
jgi:hypothetical protein